MEKLQNAINEATKLEFPVIQLYEARHALEHLQKRISVVSESMIYLLHALMRVIECVVLTQDRFQQKLLFFYPHLKTCVSLLRTLELLAFSQQRPLQACFTRISTIEEFSYRSCSQPTLGPLMLFCFVLLRTFFAAYRLTQLPYLRPLISVVRE